MLFRSKEFETLQSEVEQAAASTLAELKREYGSGFDAKMDLANRAFALAAGEKADDIRNMVLADGSRLGDNGAFIRLFSKLGESLGEDSLRGDGATQRFTKSPEQAQQELSVLAIDEQFQKILMDKTHPEHERAVERKDALYEMAYPDETPG